ncbi:hypothetical protein ACLOJK_023491, partial [Asimina triloba]
MQVRCRSTDFDTPSSPNKLPSGTTPTRVRSADRTHPEERQQRLHFRSSTIRSPPHPIPIVESSPWQESSKLITIGHGVGQRRREQPNPIHERCSNGPAIVNRCCDPSRSSGIPRSNPSPWSPPRLRPAPSSSPFSSSCSTPLLHQPDPTPSDHGQQHARQHERVHLPQQPTRQPTANQRQLETHSITRPIQAPWHDSYHLHRIISK